MSTSAWKFSELKVPRPDFKVIDAMYSDAIERVRNAESGDDVLEVIIEHDELIRRISELITITMIRHNLDTTDERYREDQDWMNQNRSNFTSLALEFSDAIYASPYREYVEGKIGHMYFDKIAAKKKTFCEENIPLRQKEADLVNEYHDIIDTCEAEIDGVPRPFWELQSMLSHEDRNVRKEAFKAFSDFLSQNEEKMEEIWDGLIKVRTEIAKNLGHDSYVPVGYLERDRLDYSREDIAQFRKQVVEEIVPLCNRLFEAQKKRLGVEQLMVYDENVLFPDGNAKQLGDADYMMNQVVNVLKEMSPETDEFITFILDHELMDYKSRPGKAAIEYSTMLSAHKAPYLFEHFNGSPSGVQYLTEGLGHAFASYRASRKQYLEEYYAPSSDITEIHAMAMIQFTNKYADRLFGEDAWKYELGNLQYFMTFIPFGAAVDEFQHICYDNPNLTPRERTYEWHKLEEKYMPWRKYDEDDEFMKRGGYWYHKVHFFSHPLYYIEYSLATVNAMEMYKKYIERPSVAWREYLDLSDVGGSKGSMEILELANLTPAHKEGAVGKSISYVKSILEEYIAQSGVESLS